jgi:hypothetical protein
MRKQKVINLTDELLMITDTMINQFEATKTQGSEPDFYTEVVPFSNKVQRIVDNWTTIVLPWIQENGFTNIHSNQVHSTKEQLEKTMVQAFFPQTSRKHFTDSIHAIQFVLKTILMEAEKQNIE